MTEKPKRSILHHETSILSKTAEWLVFIHGAGGSIATWKYQIDAFKTHYNLLLIDLRDHGHSKGIVPHHDTYDFDIVATDILFVIDHLGIEKAHFLSLSLGSVILQKLDEIRPDLPHKMIMAGGVFRATLAIRAFVHTAKGLNYLLPYRAMYHIFSRIVLPRRNHRFSREIFRQQSRKLTPIEYLKWVGLYKDFFRLLHRFFNKELQKISLVIMGDQDHVFLKAAIRFAQTHPSARLVILEKCGHICNIEQYQRFNQEALAFLKG